MKACSRCKDTKDGSAFYINKRYRDGLDSWCKQCRREYAGRPEALLALKDNRHTKLDKIFAYLRNHPCVDCGEADLQVLQFDHVRGTKVACVSALASYAPWDRIAAEIAKCDVRCANCHMRRTALQFGWRRAA